MKITKENYKNEYVNLTIREYKKMTMKELRVYIKAFKTAMKELDIKKEYKKEMYRYCYKRQLGGLKAKKYSKEWLVQYVIAIDLTYWHLAFNSYQPYVRLRYKKGR